MSDKQKQILLFEDDPADIELAVHALHKALDCNIHVVQTPRAFAEAIERQTPDIIISDSGVLGMGGLTALKLAKERRPAVPFVMCSGNTSPTKITEALEMGADSFVSKDSQFQLLIAEIKRLWKT